MSYRVRCAECGAEAEWGAVGRHRARCSVAGWVAPTGSQGKDGVHGGEKPQRPKEGRALAVLRLEPVARRLFKAVHSWMKLSVVCRGFGAAFSPQLRLRKATFKGKVKHWPAFKEVLPQLRLRKLSIRNRNGNEDHVVLEGVCASPGLRASLTELVLDTSFMGHLDSSRLQTLPQLRFIRLRDLSGAHVETILREVAPAQLQGVKISQRDDLAPPTEVELEVLERFPGLRRLGLPKSPLEAWDTLSLKAKAQLSASLAEPLFKSAWRKSFKGPPDLSRLNRATLTHQSRLGLLDRSAGSLVVLDLTLLNLASGEPPNESLRALASMGSLRELQLTIRGATTAGLLGQWTGLAKTRLERLSLELPHLLCQLPQLCAPPTLLSFHLYWKTPPPPPVVELSPKPEGGPMLRDDVALPCLRSLKVCGPSWLAGSVVGAGRELAALESLRLVGIFPLLQAPPRPEESHFEGVRGMEYSFHLSGKEVKERGGLAAVAAGLEARLDDLRRLARDKRDAQDRFDDDLEDSFKDMTRENNQRMKKMVKDDFADLQRRLDKTYLH